MGSIDSSMDDTQAVISGDADSAERAAKRALREQRRFWFEKPATRFVVYFCIFVVAEVLVGVTLHWIFHII